MNAFPPSFLSPVQHRKHLHTDFTGSLIASLASSTLLDVQRSLHLA